MDQHEKIIYFLGQIKATIELLCALSMQEEFVQLLDHLVAFESGFNQEIQRIFGPV